MNTREQTLSFLLLGLILLTVAGAGGYFLIYEPLRKQENAEVALAGEIDELENKLQVQQKSARRLAQARSRSLPADKALAEREYPIALKRLMDSAGVPKDSQISPQAVDNSPRAVPEIAKGKPVYTRVAYQLVFKKADARMLKDFLHGYYQLGLLHQITALQIKKDDDPAAKNVGRRNDLTVTLTTEAILVDGAENRRTLSPVPTAFAALGGGAAYRAITLSPEAARAVRPHVSEPVLSPVGRDYDLIVKKDPFNGPLPPPPKPTLAIAPIREVKVKTDEKPSPVHVALTGNAANGAKFTAIAEGSLFAPGALKVDQKNYSIELPATSATEGTATVNVVATSADGAVTAKTSFKVSVEYKEPEPPKPGEDISAFIILTGAAPRSDGSAWAQIFDNANRLRYTIEATPRGVSILKEYKLAANLPWRKDVDHNHPPGVLVISDESTDTRRTFKVVAVDFDGLVVADLKPSAPAAAPPPRKGFGKFPPMGGRQPAVKQGPADPLAALGGNRIAATPKPKLYRWMVGNSLARLQEIPADEAEKILKAAEAAGPVFDVSASVK